MSANIDLTAFSEMIFGDSHVKFDPKSVAFLDILSAALDESGITGDESFDFFGGDAELEPLSVDQGFEAKEENDGQVNILQPVSGEVVVNGQPPPKELIGQPALGGPVFSHALKQLASQNGPSVVKTTQAVTASPVSILQRSTSSPTIIKLPSNSMAAQGPTVLRQQSAQIIPVSQTTTNTSGRTQIITVKRVGPNGTVTQSRSFTLNGSKMPSGAQKIIVRQSNGGQPQIVRTGSPIPAQGYVSQAQPTKLVTPVLQSNSVAASTVGQLGEPSVGGLNTFEHQFRHFASQSSSASKPSVILDNTFKNENGSTGVSRSKPHIITINRSSTLTGSRLGSQSSRPGPAVLNQTLSQQDTVNLPARVTGPVPASMPNIRVIQRPFQTSHSVSPSPTFRHSLSVPAELGSYANIPSLPQQTYGEGNCKSPVPQSLNLPGLNGGKLVRNSDSGVLNGHAIGDSSNTGISSLSAMQKSVQNLPVPKASNKDVMRMWSNQDIRYRNIAQNVNIPVQSIVEEEEEGEEVEGLGQAETYSDYMPSKLKVGIKHPDPVVETNSMSAVEPPDISYRLSLPDATIDYGELSALQLESIVYASQKHNVVLPSGERGGFLIGDGAGVGKGRTLAGIIFENYLLGRKRALWLSVSNDLKVDAERDLRDIGATKIDVHSLNKFKYAKISSKVNGNVKKGVIFATYSSLIGESHSGGKYKTRFKQLMKWFGKDFDGVIVFDECHKAKNLCPVGSSKPTKTGQTVLELQKRLPMARVVYASATGASEPKNMAYMTRLGLWGKGTPFPEFNDFIQAVEKRGVGAMELVAMDMKLRGMYIARQLSFKGVSFKIEEIPIEKEFIKMYNEAVALWVDAREMFQEAANLVDAEHRMRKSMWGQFWSSHQRFFKYLCISAKVPHCVRLAKEAIRDGKCVVIGLQSTGEARTLEQLEDMGGELNDFVSTAKGVIQTLVEKHFPAPDRKKFFDIFGLNGGNYSEDSNLSSSGGIKRKREQSFSNPAKKQKSSNSDTDSSSDSEESEFDFGLSDLSDDSDDDEEDDNFNPFGTGSDSDDDPWLKKNKKAKKKKEEKKKKEKKVKKKKKKKEKEQDEDAEFDKALAAAGLLKKENPGPDGQSNPSGDAIEKAFQMKRELLDRIELLGVHLPPNTLDQLIDDLGGTENVAEMTGRKGRVVCTDEGINYESRSENDVPLEILNLTEKQRFMDGEKNIAIISEAASSGISLQADRRALNQKRRVHITLELPWSADRAIQQFGRTHRSNQVSAPEYLFLISELAGEQRFASTVSKRLESLGALTHGDRRATESRDLSRFNFDNRFGRIALEAVMKCVCGFEGTLVKFPEYPKGNFLQDAKKGLIGVGLIIQPVQGSVPILDKDYNNISKFLNRILGMEVVLQNALFQYFAKTLEAVILEAKRSGRWDMGILDLGSGGESVKKKETKVFMGNSATNTAKTELYTVTVERGMSFPSALDIWNKYTGVDDGFYISLQDRSVRRFAIVAAFQGSYNKKKEKLYTVYRPNTGLQPRQESLAEIKKKYKKVLPEEAQRYWEDQYNDSATKCSHQVWRGFCRNISIGLQCEVGLRTRTYYVLSGSVLSVWNKVESVLAGVPGGVQTKMQIIRLRTDDNERIVGSLIPTNAVNPLCNVLSQDCKTFTQKHETQVRPKPIEESQATTNISRSSSSQAVFSMPVLV